MVGLVTALLTAVYSFRSVFVPFYGEPRDQELYDHAHESPRTMTVPLWILAFLSIFGGLLNLPFVLSMEHWLEPAIGHHEAPSLTLELTAITLSVVVALFGFVLAFARYRRNEGWALRIGQGFQFLRPAIDKEWYLDRFYSRWIVRPLWAMSAWLAAVFDKKVIDGVVNWVGGVNLALGERVRHLENGLIPTYALSIFVGVTAIVAYIVFSAL